MGLQESIIVDWKDKTIEYQGKQFYIVEQFKYEGKEYLYGCELGPMKAGNLVAVFLYKVKGDTFLHVDSDSDLFEQLFMTVSGMLAGELITKEADKYKDKINVDNKK